MRYFGVAPIRWSPDGRELLVRGKGLDGYFGFYRVDATTGAAAAMVRGQARNNEDSLGASPMWGHDGRSVIYAGDNGIVQRDLPSTAERIVLPTQPDDFVFGLGPSPSGDRLAFTKGSGAGAKGFSVLAVRDASGAVTELRRHPGAASLQFLEWTRDGQQILYALNEGARVWRIWRIDASGGEPIDMKVTIESARPRVSLHPDGRSLTYSTGSTAFEVWVMRGVAH